jgi:hypothetical protein
VNTVSRCALQSPHTVLPCLPRSFHPIWHPIPSHPVFSDAAGGPTRTPASFSPSAAFGETQTDSKGLPVTNIDTPTHCRRSASPCSAALKLDYCYGAPQVATQTSSAEICRVGPTTAFPRPRARNCNHTRILSIATPHLTAPHRIAAASRNTQHGQLKVLFLAHLLRLHTYPTLARVRLGHSR